MVVGGHSIIGKLIDASQQSEKGRGTEWEQTCVPGGKQGGSELSGPSLCGKVQKVDKSKGLKKGRNTEWMQTCI